MVLPPIDGCRIVHWRLQKKMMKRFFYKASDLILHEFRKMSGKFVSVGLVKISFPVEEIYTIELDD